MHWYPEQRHYADAPLLDAYHDELLMQGVTGYERRDLQADYRLSVLWETTRPIWFSHSGFPAAVWWGNIERIHLAVDGLGSREFFD